MKSAPSDSTTFKGPVKPGSRTSHALVQPTILYQWFDETNRLVSVPPWGLILPVEMSETPFIRFSAEFQTAGLPAGTMLGMRWTPADGNNIHTSTFRLSGSETHNVVLSLEDIWLEEAEGQHVLIEHELVLPDGTTQIGTPLTVLVAKRVVFGSMTVEGLNNGDILDPDLFPDGIKVNYSPITNIAGYHIVALGWEVIGIREGGLSPLYVGHLRLPGAPGESYQFIVPPEGYKDLFDPAWERIHINAIVDVKLAPEPNRWMYYSYGSQRFHLVGPGK